ncbi:hypothetical protein, partial [Nocardia abscessus]|uniref:hypothetical protein n=1 Tax=Nocardia abscessus TaxID=120957 RepID=UPI002458D8B9
LHSPAHQSHTTTIATDRRHPTSKQDQKSTNPTSQQPASATAILTTHPQPRREFRDRMAIAA